MAAIRSGDTEYLPMHVFWPAAMPCEIALIWGNIQALYVLLSAGARVEMCSGFHLIMNRWECLKFFTKYSYRGSLSRGTDLKFCSEEDKAIFLEYFRLVNELVNNPQSLQMLACIKVRKCVGEGLRQKSETLPLPSTIKERLLLPHLNDLKKPRFQRIANIEELSHFD